MVAMFVDDMRLHERAKRIANELLSREAELLEVLMEMKKRRAFEVLGYRGVFEYVQKALKLSDAQAFYYQKVVQKSFEVPALPHVRENFTELSSSVY